LSRYAGDLINNFVTDKNGNVNYTYIDNKLSVSDIVGRLVVIHKGQDDLELGVNADSLLTGNAGDLGYWIGK